jgi:hypothetical protein
VAHLLPFSEPGVERRVGLAGGGEGVDGILEVCAVGQVRGRELGKVDEALPDIWLRCLVGAAKCSQ